MAMKLTDAQRALIAEKEGEEKEKVLEVKNLVISFKTDNGLVQAVRGISFDLHKQETLCIVGESGSGKSVTSKAIMGILAPNAIVEGGQILYEGEDLLKVSEEEFHRLRGHKIGMIFQDPLSSLNPIVKIGKQIIETMMINKNALKNRYNDLIAKELVEYKNAKVDRDFAIDSTANEVNLVLYKKSSEKASYERDIEAAKEHIVDLKRLAKDRDSLLKLEQEHTESVTAKETAHRELEEAKAKYEANSEGKRNLTAYEIRYARADEKEMALSMRLKAVKEAEAKGGIESQIAEYQSIIASRLESIKGLNEKYASELSEKKAKAKEAKIAANKEYKEKVPALKAALKAKKVVAKKDCAEYKEEAKKELADKLADIEAKKAKISLSEEDKAELADIRSKKRAIKLKYGTLEKLFYVFPKKHQAYLAKADELLMPLDERERVLNKPYLDLEEEALQAKEAYQKKTKITKAIAMKRALSVMKEVGIPQPEKRFYQYPFQFSGGMRQRIVIAIALTATPDILICDEPTTALDVTIQAQILELINRLKEERHLSCIFITHDLGVVANMADRVAVMYAGKIVEFGTEKEVFFDPRHPYTWALLSSIPDIDSKEKLEAIPGTPPDMIYPPIGDAFARRNKYALGIDFKAEPPFFKISDTHYAATWLEYEGAPDVEPPAIVKTRILNALKEEEERRNEKR